MGIIREFDADIRMLVESVRPTFERIVARGRIPINALVVPLSEASLKDVERLYHRCFPDGAETISCRLRGEYRGVRIDQSYSYVLRSEAAVLGFVLVLYEPFPDSKFVFSVGVAPTHRRTWANAMLKHETLRRLIERNVSRIRFEADPEKVDALNHARRSEARVVASYDWP